MVYVLVVDGAVSEFPYSMDQFRKDNPRVSLPMYPTPEQLSEFGLFPVHVQSIPELASSEEITGAEIVNINGVWTKTWIVSERPLEASRANMLAEIKAKQEAIKASGWTHQFSVGTHTLDLRNADDKVNWTLLLMKAGGMVSAGAGDALVNIRTAADVTISIPATEAQEAMLAFLDWGGDLMTAKWDLDTLVMAAEDNADLDSIDINEGWPQ